MNVLTEMTDWQAEHTAWRRDIHAHPELAFEETRTADFVADQLQGFGLDVARGLAKTGVVATLSRGRGPSIGLRADLDALPMQEANTFSHRSVHDGRMHACGHDGHTVMLLAAARYLALHPDLSGTVHFVFQPAEEAAGGARVMVEEGLFDDFPMEAIFGMHNWPLLPAGHFAVGAGPMMASLDCFDVIISGTGTHGALPHEGVDPILVATQVIGALQSIVSRNVDPLHAAVVSVTKIQGGDAYNIIPERVTLGGGIRCFDEQLRETIKRRVVQIAEHTCAALGATAQVEFHTEYPVLINSQRETAIALEVAKGVSGDHVHSDPPRIMGSEDFAYMLLERPGCYVFIGNGGKDGGCMVHNPRYDFNDDVIPVGASYWVELATRYCRA